jgi:hypothetical protein
MGQDHRDVKSRQGPFAARAHVTLAEPRLEQQHSIRESRSISALGVDVEHLVSGRLLKVRKEIKMVVWGTRCFGFILNETKHKYSLASR